MRTPIRWALAGWLLGSHLGCDFGEPASAAPSRECREFGALCGLENGPLGVCESRACGSGETPPCLVCTSQH
jgi:hypothetical protein